MSAAVVSRGGMLPCRRSVRRPRRRAQMVVEWDPQSLQIYAPLSVCLWVPLIFHVTVWAYITVSMARQRDTWRVEAWFSTAVFTGAPQRCFLIELNSAAAYAQIMVPLLYRHTDVEYCLAITILWFAILLQAFFASFFRPHWEALHHARLTCGRQDTVQVDPPYYATPTQHTRSTP